MWSDQPALPDRSPSATPSALPDEAWLVALAGLHGIGPRRLAALVEPGGPRAAWQALLAGGAEMDAVLGRDASTIVANARRVHVDERWALHQRAAIGVAQLGSVAYPPELAADIEAPYLLLWQGDPAVLDGPRVAIVGTRRCTRYGYEVAEDLGRALAEAGVSVVSGLALGIDAAAHRGALSVDGAPPVGVVATGLDVVYPRRNRSLWQEVGRRGVLLSESALGTSAERWRFPSRNRIIAALAPVLVVVESHASGGSLHTVTEAQARGGTVMAVPGPIRSGASEGTNRLIADGALVVTSSEDVLTTLGMTSWNASRPPAPAEPNDPVLVRLLDSFCWQPRTSEQLLAEAALGLAAGLVALQQLEELGLVVRRGAFLERAMAGRADR